MLLKNIIKSMYICTCNSVLCQQDGATALHLAAQEGTVDVVKLLIDAEAQVNIQAEVHTLYVHVSCWVNVNE